MGKMTMSAIIGFSLAITLLVLGMEFKMADWVIGTGISIIMIITAFIITYYMPPGPFD